MTTMTIADRAARLVFLKDQQAALQAEIDQINESFRSEGLGKHDAGDWTVTVRSNRRLDAARFEQRFPVAQYPAYYKPAVDVNAIKDYFAPVELDQWYSEGTPVVVVK